MGSDLTPILPAGALRHSGILARVAQQEQAVLSVCGQRDILET